MWPGHVLWKHAYLFCAISSGETVVWWELVIGYLDTDRGQAGPDVHRPPARPGPAQLLPDVAISQHSQGVGFNDLL